TWSVPRMIDSVAEAPVALRNAGTRMLRCASFQVPGKVAATSVLLCANARDGRMALPPSAAAPRSTLRRSMRSVMSELLCGSFRWLSIQVMAGLDPAIHRLRKKPSCEEDGPAGRKRVHARLRRAFARG